MSQKIRYTSIFLITLSSLLCGCGEDPDALPAPPPAAPAPAPTVGAAPASAISAPPPTGAPAAPIGGPAAAPVAEVEVPSKDALEAVTMAAQSFFIAHERAPKSLEELVSSGYLRKLPTPPAGKKYVYDPERANISLADQ